MKQKPKKKLKEISLPMRFNLGTLSSEPDLAKLKKIKMKKKKKIRKN